VDILVTLFTLGGDVVPEIIMIKVGLARFRRVHMFALVVETVVFIAFLTGGTYLCGGVTGVAAILHVVAFQTTSKAASLVVKRPGDQIRREAFQARRAIRAVLAPC
jgi:hypothetical protein